MPEKRLPGRRKEREARLRSISPTSSFSLLFFHFPHLVKEKIHQHTSASPFTCPQFLSSRVSTVRNGETEVVGQLAEKRSESGYRWEDEEEEEVVEEVPSPSPRSSVCPFRGASEEERFREKLRNNADTVRPSPSIHKEPSSAGQPLSSSRSFSSSGLFHVYLPSTASRALSSYVYKGEDRSYLYQYIWRPLCRRSVTAVPTNISANAITVLAVIQGMIPFILHVTYPTYLAYTDLWSSHACSSTASSWRFFPCMWSEMINRSSTSSTTPFYVQNHTDTMTPGTSVMPTGGGDHRTSSTSHGMRTERVFHVPPFTAIHSPSFVFVLNAMALLLYQYLDNLDGHQARNLNMSSPLGLWLDHGCDAFHSVVMGFCVSSYLSLGASWKTLLVLCSTLSTFFMNTWEEYHLGELILPVINGPNEGLWILSAMYLWTAFKGSAWWLGECTLLYYDPRLTPSLSQPYYYVSSLLCPWLSKWGLCSLVGGGREGVVPAGSASPPTSTTAVAMTFGCYRHTIFVWLLVLSAFFTCVGNWYNVMIFPLRKRYRWRRIWRRCHEEGKRQMKRIMDARPPFIRYMSQGSTGSWRSRSADASSARDSTVSYVSSPFIARAEGGSGGGQEGEGRGARHQNGGASSCTFQRGGRRQKKKGGGRGVKRKGKKNPQRFLHESGTSANENSKKEIKWNGLGGEGAGNVVGEVRLSRLSTQDDSFLHVGEKEQGTLTFTDPASRSPVAAGMSIASKKKRKNRLIREKERDDTWREDRYQSKTEWNEPKHPSVGRMGKEDIYTPTIAALPSTIVGRGGRSSSRATAAVQGFLSSSLRVSGFLKHSLSGALACEMESDAEKKELTKRPKKKQKMANNMINNNKISNHNDGVEDVVMKGMEEREEIPLNRLNSSSEVGGWSPTNWLNLEQLPLLSHTKWKDTLLPRGSCARSLPEEEIAKIDDEEDEDDEEDDVIQVQEVVPANDVHSHDKTHQNHPNSLHEKKGASHIRMVVIKEAEVINQRDAWVSLIPVIYLTAVTFLTAFCTDAFSFHPYLFSSCVGLLYTYITISLMLAHMCAITLSQCPSTTWWYFLTTTFFFVLMGSSSVYNGTARTMTGTVEGGVAHIPACSTSPGTTTTTTTTSFPSAALSFSLSSHSCSRISVGNGEGVGVGVEEDTSIRFSPDLPLYLSSFLSLLRRNHLSWVPYQYHVPSGGILLVFLLVLFSLVHFAITSAAEMAKALKIHSIFHVPPHKRYAIKERNKRRFYVERLKTFQSTVMTEGGETGGKP